MTISADTLRLHLDYTAWASARLLEAAGNLSPEEVTRNFDTADKSVAGTLGHIFAADRVWMARVEGVTLKAFISPEDRELDYLQREWPALLDRWRKWAAGFTDETTLECATYRDLKGNEWSTPYWQIIMHVVNHGTHHRGQVAGFLRAMGKIPPPLDLIAYYRVLGQAAKA
jgi:uncharacterized damage-inducible protein DinB